MQMCFNLLSASYSKHSKEKANENIIITQNTTSKSDHTT